MRTGGAIYNIIDIIFNAIYALLALRIIFRFFGANPATPFVNWLYETTGSLIAPFANIFPNPRLSGSFVIDISAVVGLVVYSFVGYVALSFIADLISKNKAKK